jgi:hypothetical protein
VLFCLSVSPYDLILTVPVTGTALGPMLSFCLPGCELFAYYLCRNFFFAGRLNCCEYTLPLDLSELLGAYCWAMNNKAKDL